MLEGPFQGGSTAEVVSRTLGRHYLLLLPGIALTAVTIDISVEPFWEAFIVPRYESSMKNVIKSIASGIKSAVSLLSELKRMTPSLIELAEAVEKAIEQQPNDPVHVGIVFRRGLRRVMGDIAIEVVKANIVRDAIELSVCAVAHKMYGQELAFHLWSLKRSFDNHWTQRYIPLPNRFYKYFHLGPYIAWDRCIELQGSLKSEQAVLLATPEVVATELLNAWSSYRWLRMTQLNRTLLVSLTMARAIFVAPIRLLLALWASRYMVRTGGKMWFFNPARGQAYLAALAILQWTKTKSMSSKSK